MLTFSEANLFSDFPSRSVYRYEKLNFYSSSLPDCCFLYFLGPFLIFPFFAAVLAFVGGGGR